MSSEQRARRPGGARSRRRGEALEEAIHGAVLAELIERGYAGLTMERVAERARTGKSSLYRRWECLESLVLDTLGHTLPSLDSPAPDTGSLRGDLTFMLNRMARVLHEPAGQAMYTLVAAGDRQPAIVRAVDERLIQPRIELLCQGFRRAAERGEIEPSDAWPVIARVGPALIIQEFLLTGKPTDEDGIAMIIDHVILPALGRR
ncbi:TetR/AcrR family transcriptional regulator [Gandjariella thermophila]|uniref:TetR family transcriptional regulator n=1 Tax=Gandjariella thermophila TaxID=1931992 RepID=A0A4D4J5D0_9PSEU|nr:TetR/AcrR family transcriptional regulator [Gandjariella thermophila]GDY31741.1 TetR family transcriptional regulator [Gandjariella thermophila]